MSVAYRDDGDVQLAGSDRSQVALWLLTAWGAGSAAGRVCYFMASRSSRQACSQRRQASAQTRQCCM